MDCPCCSETNDAPDLDFAGSGDGNFAAIHLSTTFEATSRVDPGEPFALSR
jgi:hypothetical protein